MKYGWKLKLSRYITASSILTSTLRPTPVCSLSKRAAVIPFVAKNPAARSAMGMGTLIGLPGSPHRL